MNTNEHKWITETIVGAAYEVANVLGCGFLEKVYERALVRELEARGVRVQTQVAFGVDYKGECVGQYVADLLVEGEVLVELKCVESFANEHIAQCINYLRASGRELALLVNFQRAKVEWRRIVYTKNNERLLGRK